MLEFYDNYLQNIAQTPEEKYRDNAQAYVNSAWENTFLLTNVQEETTVGRDEYVDMEVRKTTVIEYSVNMFKNADDNRRLTFKNCEHKVERGLKYKFNDNYWITYSDTDEENLYSQILIRRCNNELKWIDKTNGAIHSEPCCMGEEYSGTNPNENKGVQVASGKVIIMVQGNEFTDTIDENQRFIISGVPYKLVAYNNYAQNNYIEKDNRLLWFYVIKDTESPQDDIQNGIADRYSYKYNITINSEDFEQKNGYIGLLNADIKLNDKIVKRDIVWSGNKFVSIKDNGEFVLNGTDGDIATIKAHIYGNPNIYDEVNITIIDVVQDDVELVINPLYTELRQGKTVKFDVDISKNNVKQNAIITYTTNQIDLKHYQLSQNGNEFTLTNKFTSSTPLEITFNGDGISKTITIKLKPVF